MRYIRNRRGRRGMMLLEVLITIAIIALVSGAITIAVIKYGEDAKLKMALVNARALRHAAKLWQAEGGTACPTIDDLVQAEVIERGTSTKDPWNHEFEIRCSDRGTVVLSRGKDGRAGTEDDIRVPPEEAG